MSDCGCKNGAKGVTEKDIDKVTLSNSLLMRIFIFLISLAVVGIVLIPIIIPFMVIMLFNRIVLRRNANVNGFLLKLGKAFKNSKKDDETDIEEGDDITGEDINPEEYELMDVDVINK